MRRVRHLIPEHTNLEMLSVSTGRAGCYNGLIQVSKKSCPRPKRFLHLRQHENGQRGRLRSPRGSLQACSGVITTRGVKTHSVLNLDLLARDDNASPDQVPTEVEKAYPAVVQQASDNMQKHPQCVLLTRVGGFYELYFDHADTYGPLLNLKVAQKKTKEGPVSMSGFPYYQLERFLKILVQDMGKHVAIADEFPNDAAKMIKSGGNLFDRKISRIITPGTLIDEHFMDPFQSNYLLSVHVDADSIHIQSTPEGLVIQSSLPDRPDTESAIAGLAWLDLSSGDFFTQMTPVTLLSSAIARIRPREILLDAFLEDPRYSKLVQPLKAEGHVLTFQESPTIVKKSDWQKMFKEAVGSSSSTKFSQHEVAAGASLLAYVKTQLQGSQTHLQAPVQHQLADFMSIDRNSFRALEIRSTQHDGTAKGSLLHAVKRTVTPDGTRLLASRLTEPSLSLSVINERLDLVSLLKDHASIRETITGYLRLTSDSPRLASKFALGRGDADDLISLAKTIDITIDLAKSIKAFLGSNAVQTSSCSNGNGSTLSSWRDSLQNLLKRLSLDGPRALATRIKDSIDEDGLSRQHQMEDETTEVLEAMAQDVVGAQANELEIKQLPKRLQPKKQQRIISSSTLSGSSQEPFIMRPDSSDALKELHEHLDDLEEQQDDLQNELRQTHVASSLTLRWTPGLGHIAHVKGKDRDKLKALDNRQPVSTSKSTKSFYITAWTELGKDMDETRFRIRTEEQRVLSSLRQEVVQNLVKLRRNASVLAELDVSSGFAELAAEKEWIRPILNEGVSHNISAGRHPVVETGLSRQGRTFTSNDCTVGEDERIWLITGPNMAGKSTFLRQNALISILAQTGSFVPAGRAEIGLVDKIFTRVGSADNLYQDQSTFMVEMAETAEILKEATPRSFVIMDEVGRGTTPEDGVAVGYACLDHLYRINRCRTIFATHFHTLADMTKGFDKLGCYCSDVSEQEDGSFSYVHRLRAGVNRQSHALKVARVAGMPEEAIKTAAKVLADLKVPTTSLST
ncbi:DNA mismatch repair protein Msh1 [Pseudovirgaria hyperparasitica]|uniref:DNA mismatch repair protein Msh1 n=1 Tax=Pseudovirgaria hyperparasitica TaxID=470096 RepID=A0A6A6VY93_9PEZI|nr:DNA mismatch repair protein Msh1 [Pseudovirgaria hyperparasitica]KAF2754257.1 DNA mismatch repair protein Msh1 [Pseudovirgaria hyperparasitica]